MSDKILADRLATFEVTPDGSRVCMNVLDEEGRPCGLSLPSECLTQLIMTLPQMAARALKARSGDDTLRIVYSLEAMRVEAANVKETTILTFETPDGFAVSFGLTIDHLKQLERAARDARTAPRPIFLKN